MGLCSSKSTEAKPDLQFQESATTDIRRPSARPLGSKTSKIDLLKVDKYAFVIVGFGVAGGYAAKELADLGVKDFDVALVGEEPTFSYERPALSKAYMFPPGNPDKIPIRLPKFHTSVAVGGPSQGEEWYRERNWTCYLSTKAIQIDYKKKLVTCLSKNGEEWIRFEKLIVCTGSKPNKLTCPGSDLKSIYYIRNEVDSAALIRRLERETGNVFEDRKLAPMKIKSGVLQSTRRLDQNEQREFDNIMKSSGNMEDSMIPEDMEQPVHRIVVLGGGFLGIELACSLTGWGLDEICLVFDKTDLFHDLNWSAKFRGKVQAEIIRRAPRIKLFPNNTVEKILPRNDQTPAVGEVILKEGGISLETHALVVCIGATPCGKEIFQKKSFIKNELALEDDLKVKSTDGADIWVCGELAVRECGVEAARNMGKFAAKRAYDSWISGTDAKKSEPYINKTPFRYSRLFEYTSNPLIWYQIGDFSLISNWTEKFCGELNECGFSGAFASFYYDENQFVKAAVACGSSTEKEYLESLRKLIETNTASLEQVVNQFKEKYDL